MRSILLVLLIGSVFLNGANSFITEVYPKVTQFSNDGDPGEPLFLTNYIVNGDIATVRKHISKIS